MLLNTNRKYKKIVYAIVMNSLLDFCIYRFKSPNGLDNGIKIVEVSSPQQKAYKCCANFCCNSFQNEVVSWSIHLSINNRIHSFCCIACKNEFLSDPSSIGCYSPVVQAKDEPETTKEMTPVNLNH